MPSFPVFWSSTPAIWGCVRRLVLWFQLLATLLGCFVAVVVARGRARTGGFFNKPFWVSDLKPLLASSSSISGCHGGGQGDREKGCPWVLQSDVVLTFPSKLRSDLVLLIFVRVQGHCRGGSDGTHRKDAGTGSEELAENIASDLCPMRCSSLLRTDLRACILAELLWLALGCSLLWGLMRQISCLAPIVTFSMCS